MLQISTKYSLRLGLVPLQKTDNGLAKSLFSTPLLFWVLIFCLSEEN